MKTATSLSVGIYKYYIWCHRSWKGSVSGWLFLQLSSMSNLKRHLKRHEGRGESWQHINLKPREVEKYSYLKLCCGKAFKKSLSRLVKHLDDVHSMTYVEIVCCELSCLKYFTNAEALRENVQQNHNCVCYEVCRNQQLKKQIKRHMRIHESQTCVERIQCQFDNWLHGFTRKSNLNQHIRAVHLGLRSFKCRFRGCEMNFAHKSVRENHDKTGRHCYVEGINYLWKRMLICIGSSGFLGYNWRRDTSWDPPGGCYKLSQRERSFI